jgi:hypothetical protein
MLTQKLKLGLIVFIVALTSCASQPQGTIQVVKERPHIPKGLLVLPEYPTKPLAPRTNEEMMKYRLEVERALCILSVIFAETVRYATLGDTVPDSYRELGIDECSLTIVSQVLC